MKILIQDGTVIDGTGSKGFIASVAIENDRIQAVIDLLNMAEDNTLLSHLINRIVR